ncbi:receptor-type tyrosine-protein phosphatase N2-like [Stigmatopora nigra]
MLPLSSFLHLLLFLLLRTSSPASADRRFGCLFEADLCTPLELCVNDGMFGRCRSAPVQDAYSYDVTLPVVQHFRLLLDKMAAAGLTWEDDTSQHILAKELSKVRRIPQRSPSNTWSAAPVEAELSRNLQAYLRRVGLLPKPDLPVSETSPSFKVQRKPSADELRLLLGYLRLALRPVSAPGSSRSRPDAPGPPAKDPLTSVDEKFIQKVLKNMGRQHLDVERLTPHDMDQLSDFIVDALQVVDKNGHGVRARDSEGGEEEGGRKEDEDAETSSPLPPAGVQSLSNDDKVKGKAGDGNVFGKLLSYLDQKASGSSSSTPPPAPPPHDRRQDSLQKKDAAQSLEEVSAVAGWLRETGPAPPLRPPPAVAKYQHADRKAPEELQLDVKAADDDVFGYVITDTDVLPTDQGLHLMEILAAMARIQITDMAELSVVGPAVTFKVSPNRQNVTTADVARVAEAKKTLLEKEAKLSILETGVANGKEILSIPGKYSQAESTKFLALTVASVSCMAGVLLASSVVYCLRHRSHHKLKEKLSNLGTDAGQDATAAYQELCRQRMSGKPPAERPEPSSSRINSVSSQFSDGGGGGGGGGASAVSPSARGSLSSWSEEPAQPSMDISTGHMILSYMEDHLKNKNRLEKEWEALCAYQAEPNACTAGLKDGNAKKNRSPAVVAYDHSRITLRLENSQGNSDYINASPIMDHDPRNPAYIVTQGPLPSTVADFWQMVWENGCVVIVMLTPLVENGVKQCYHYWPDEGSNLYHIYEVNLVSEHVWCDDFLVRSFYLKNMQTNETRTVTQFHFLTWLNQNVPETSRTLLDFRRKVNKCYRGRACPIIVHCSDGAGRSGTYVLVDMVLNKMAKGAKEIDIAATLEHLRDQRPGMVNTKDQFEFALTTVAEEVNAILKSLPQ